MPIGLTVDNPQSQYTAASVTPTVSGSTNIYGGNALGSGATTATTASTSGSTISTILLYGAIALVVIFILKRMQEK